MNTRPLRLRPGVVLAVLMVLVYVAVPLVAPSESILGMLGAVAAGLLIILWWLFASRAPWVERIGALLVLAAAMLAVRPLLDPSIAGAGQGIMFYMFAITTFALAIVVASVLGRGMSPTGRRAAMAVSVMLAIGFWTLVRTDGVTGDGNSQFHWRWTPTAEERLLAQTRNEPQAPVPAATASPEAPAAAPAATAAGSGPEKTAPAAVAVEAIAAAPMRVDWPGFRGPDRDSRVRGVKLATDWTASAPVAIWRRPIGPGWSSFAVGGGLLFTQEQLGDQEVVTAYRAATGEPVWRHRDAARFYESNGGPGPRGTPTLHEGRLYTLGATSILNALDAATGRVIWTRNPAKDHDVATPGWGFTSSPLVAGDLVIVAASGRLAAYDRATGAPRWTGPAKGGSYSSPQMATIDGVPQVLLSTGTGVISLSPADGSLLWEHAWGDGGAIVQPAVTADGDVLITTITSTGGEGIRRVAVTRDSNGWTARERWTSRGLKPYFNDYVVHEGHAYGFDGSILSCIDLNDGARKWKGGRYGNGQMILLPEQDLILVMSEDGDLVLLAAAADTLTEIAKAPALNAKTWNHPVLVGDMLYTRNGEEMAAFRLPVAR